MSEEPQDHVAGIVEELQAIIDGEKTSAADKLKAVAMKIDVLGLKPQGVPPGGSIPIDEGFNTAMLDPIFRKRALKLEQDTQKAIERATR